MRKTRTYAVARASLQRVQSIKGGVVIIGSRAALAARVVRTIGRECRGIRAPFLLTPPPLVPRPASHYRPGLDLLATRSILITAFGREH